mmetsp:Transcript_11057/g.10005  ORF Transcript_11057/g.10005 Transcript_11057/m.10005 type:complete len:85 (-) Transcript_11057:33-287(-)
MRMIIRIDKNRVSNVIRNKLMLYNINAYDIEYKVDIKTVIPIQLLNDILLSSGSIIPLNDMVSLYSSFATVKNNIVANAKLTHG